jgi:hypothetical protein
MKFQSLKIFFLVGVLSPGVLSAQNEIRITRDVLTQWVETKQIISEEKADWKVEASILNDTLELLTAELKRLSDSLQDLDASATAADEERTQLAARKEALTAASAAVESSIGGLETQMKRIIRSLPDPLIKQIQPLIRRIPEDPEQTKLSLGERVQNIVGILSQADKFNGSLTDVSDSREIREGKVVEVRTLYWGLAMAYFVDASGDYAGVGFPGADGWEWSQVESAGSEIKRLMEIYAGSGDIEFIEVPARVQ